MLMAPSYFAGDIRFGTITQVSFAFNRIEAALSYVVNHLASLSSLAAETERLDALLSALSAAAQGGGGGGAGSVRHVEVGDASRGGGGVALDELTLLTPRGEQVLCRGLSLALYPGQSLLIVGPSGAGKSSLVRAIAGLWSTGSGAIATPPRSSLFFLPQKPYMPLGTLRQQLTFPDHLPRLAAAGLKAGGDVESSGGEEAELRRLLQVVCLPNLLQRVGGLDAECDWAHVLSLGEQQRVAFLRLLRRRPAVAFLDESTSGVDAATEAELYAALAAACPCYVSIGHRRELVAFHTHVLRATGDGRWELVKAAEHAAAHS